MRRSIGYILSGLVMIHIRKVILRIKQMGQMIGTIKFQRNCTISLNKDRGKYLEQIEKILELREKSEQFYFSLNFTHC